jgi:hypothetical protein
MEQGWVLQFCRAEMLSQALPPKATLVMTDLDLLWTPPPQSSEQVPQSDQLERTQSMGQASSLQLLVLRSSPHSMPPLDARVITDLVVDWVPVPQDWEQVPQAAQPDKTQSTAQVCVKQAETEV